MEAATTAWGAARKPARQLAQVYGAIAEWMLYPDAIAPEWREDGIETAAALEAAAAIDPEVAEHLRAFGAEGGWIDDEEYVRLYELNPRYPLYLGTHQFDEPTTCSAAGVSDRNTYMLEIANIYRHFGVELRGELPDHVPVMTEFLAITSDCAPHDDEVRLRLIDKLMLEGVRILAGRMEEGGVPHAHLLAALQRCLELELVGLDGGVDLVDAAAREPAPLIQVQEVPGA